MLNLVYHQTYVKPFFARQLTVADDIADKGGRGGLPNAENS